MRVRDMMERLAKEDPDLEVTVRAYQALEDEAHPYGEPVLGITLGCVGQANGCRRRVLKLRTGTPLFQRHSILEEAEGFFEHLKKAMRIP